ncbi:MAG: hypothetical protein H6828_00745 [Planctomycetes bacterium]|nr:hypothetical protein [Planctomycetota bacterium]
MELIVGDPALRRLAVLKLRGGVRKQLRRLKTPSGLLFMLVGTGLTGLWLTSLFLRGRFDRGTPSSPEELRAFTKLGMLALTVVSGVSALNVRGVYLPKNEIERLFAAPVSRANLVRYRMLVDLGRTLFGALVLGLLTCRHMPRPLFGFVGAGTGLLTLGVARQFGSLVVADASSRLGRWAKGRRLLFVRILMGFLVWALFMALIFGRRFTDNVLGDLVSTGDLRALVDLPVVRVVLAPFTPWASLMTATSAGEFAAWGAFCLALWLGLFELTARLRVDFREASLDTSADIAKRLRRVGRGAALQGEVSRAAAGKRVPWLFGRGPLGAVAWLKTVAIWRKARTNLVTGVLIVVLVTVMVSFLTGKAVQSPGPGALLGSSALIGLLGVMYLSGALRYDFRADVDLMEQMKAWPVAPTRLFVATLLPQVALISTLLGAAILVRAAVLQRFHPGLLGIVAALPFVLFTWISVDNAVFLFAPIRYVPGQEGTLHNSGRAVVLVFLRILLLAVALALVAGPSAALLLLGPDWLGLSRVTAALLSLGIGVVVMLGMAALLAWIGGRMLRRYDVSREQV